MASAAANRVEAGKKPHDGSGGWHDGVRLPKRERVNGTKRYRTKSGDDDADDEDGPVKQTVEFPRTVAAARAKEASQWSLGDALIDEVGKPPEQGAGPDGSYALIERAREVLLKNGVEYAAETLRKIRNTAAAFRPSARRPVSFHMHREAGTPAALDACIASLPAGEKLTVDFVQAFVRARRDAPPRPKDKGAAPVNIAGLIAPLVAALKMLTKPSRVAAIAGLMKALGIGFDDFGRQREAARRLAGGNTRAPVGERVAAA